MKLWRVLFVVVGIAALTAEARAQADLLGPRPVGMGEAMRATASGSAALLLNPSAMSLNRQYIIDAHYGFRVEDRGHNLMASITDSVTSRVAAGLYYAFINSGPVNGFPWAGGFVSSARGKRQGHVTGLALSMGFGGKFNIGLTTKYLNFKTTYPLPKGTVPSSVSFDSVNGVTFDVGLTGRIADKFNIALVAQNLWDHKSPETPTTLGVGLAVTPIPALSINFDTAVNFTGHKEMKSEATMENPSAFKLVTKVGARLGPGIEWLIANQVPLRVGVVWDSYLKSTYVTAGLGYQSKTFGVDVGYRGKVSNGVENYILLGLRIFVN